MYDQDDVLHDMSIKDIGMSRRDTRIFFSTVSDKNLQIYWYIYKNLKQVTANFNLQISYTSQRAAAARRPDGSAQHN